VHIGSSYAVAVIPSGMSYEDDWAEFTAMEGTTEGVECPICHGAGMIPDAGDWCGIESGGTVRCPTCRGTGVVPARAPVPSIPAAAATSSESST